MPTRKKSGDDQQRDLEHALAVVDGVDAEDRAQAGAAGRA